MTDPKVYKSPYNTSSSVAPEEEKQVWPSPYQSQVLENPYNTSSSTVSKEKIWNSPYQVPVEGKPSPQPPSSVTDSQDREKQNQQNEEAKKEEECYLTEEQLKKIMPYATDANIKKYLTPINDTLKKYEINTPLRVAHFLAQLAHESGSLKYIREIADGTAYEGRKDLGNTELGDGPRFKGRGLIQLTGRANYKKYGDSINADLVSNPENLENPGLAADVAGWFWNEHKLNQLADKDDIGEITKKINGGTNGLEDRKNYLEKAKATKLCKERNSINGITVTSPKKRACCSEEPTPFNADELCKSGCSYYQKRHDDYVFRHSCCKSKSSPPDYYLDYGLKYCEKFTQETYPKLSPQGQQWLKKARCNLQIRMEKGLQNKPELESSSEKFRKFAFDTHPKAYLDAGLADLSPKDWFYISTTPELKEWLKPETWQQAIETGTGVAGKKIKDISEWTKDFQNWLKNFFDQEN